MRSLFLLGREQDRRDDAVELRAPPDDTVFVASSLGYPLEPRNVSTTLPNLRGSFLAGSFVLYRALVASLRVTAMAVRHSCGRGGKREVERPRVVAIESQGRRGADAHPGVGSNPRQRRPERGRAAVRGEDATDGWGCPVSVWLREGRARAQRPRGPSVDRPACGPSSWAARGTVLISFFGLCKILLCV